MYICTWKHRGERPFGTLYCSWTDNIKTNLIEVLCKGADWIQLVEDVFQWQHFVNYYLSMALGPFVRSWPLFSFLILYTVGRTARTRDQPVARPLLIHRTTQTQNKGTQISMPRVAFEPTTLVFERAKTVLVLDREATVIGFGNYWIP
jgi:hypothetical protein